MQLRILKQIWWSERGNFEIRPDNRRIPHGQPPEGEIHDDIEGENVTGECLKAFGSLGARFHATSGVPGHVPKEISPATWLLKSRGRDSSNLWRFTVILYSIVGDDLMLKMENIAPECQSQREGSSCKGAVMHLRTERNSVKVQPMMCR